MWITSLLLALLATTADLEPSDLAARLNDPDPAARVEAADALLMLGLDALPALREAAGSDDPELSRRARDLAVQVRATRLLRPTRVTIAGGERPLAEAVADLGQRSGFGIALADQEETDWAARRVTLEDAQDVPFWEALDRLAGAGDAHLRFRPPLGLSPGSLHLSLVDGATPDVPTTRVGPYRLALTDLIRHRQVAEVRQPDVAQVAETFTVRLLLAAEPEILIARNGPIQLLEAVDDRGRDLRPASTEDADPHQSSFRQWDQPELSTVRYNLPLHLSEDRGGRIARLSGYIPIVAVGRVDEILTFHLARAVGKTFTGGGIAVELRSFDVRSIKGGTPTDLELAIRGVGVARESFAPGSHQSTLAAVELPFEAADAIRIDDAEGRPLRFMANLMTPFPNRSPRDEGFQDSPANAAVFRLQIYSDSPPGPPARLRLFGIGAVATEIPFVFEDLPIP